MILRPPTEVLPTMAWRPDDANYGEYEEANDEIQNMLDQVF